VTSDNILGLDEVTNKNYLKVLARALDLVRWSDKQADSYSLSSFGVPEWDKLSRSQAEEMIASLVRVAEQQLAQE